MLTQKEIDEIDATYNGEDAPTYGQIIDDVLKLVEDIRALREIAKHAGAHARGDESSGKLIELLDATGDPELMFSR